MRTVLKSPVLLVTVATSFELVHALESLPLTDSIVTILSVSVSDSFLSNISAISSRSRQNGLQYAVKGYIQNIKINNKGDTTIIEAKAYSIKK